MTSPENFVEDIMQIDKNFHATCIPTQDPDFIPFCKKFWLSNLQKYIDLNKDAISKNIESFKAAAKKNFKSLSPMFKSFLGAMKYQDFPYQITQKEYAGFVKKLTSAKNPAAAEAAVRDFKAEDRYFLDTKLRPWHPIWYMLLELEKTHFDIDTQALITSIYPFLLFPQNKNRASLLCALSAASGITITALNELESVKKYDSSVVKVTNAGKTTIRPVLCKVDHFIQAAEFMIAQEYSKGRMSKVNAENNAAVIGFPISLHHIPALHRAVCEYFFTASAEDLKPFREKYELTFSSKAEFSIRGPSNLDQIIEGFVRKREEKLSQILQNSDEKMRTALHKVHTHFVQNPTEKVGIISIRSIHPCSPNYATQINNHIDSLDEIQL